MKSSVNLTIIFIAVAVVVLAGLAGGVILTIYGFDAGAFYGFFTATLASVIGFGGLMYSQNKQTARLTQIDSKVNGNLSKLIEIATGQAPTRRDMREVERIAEESGLDTGEVDLPH